MRTKILSRRIPLVARVARVAVPWIIAAVAAACGAGAPASPVDATDAVAATATPTPITITIGLVGTQSFSPWRAGTLLGIFPREGIEVEVIAHRGGSEAAQALVGGGLDVFIGDISHAIRLNQQGQQIQVIAAGSNNHAYTLIGVPNSTTDLQALRGKKIGITSPGSQTDTSMRWLLKNNGLDPDKDVELVAIGGGAPMAAALQVGQISAGMVAQPFTAELEQLKYPVIYDFTALPYQGTVIMAKQSWTKERAEVVRRFLKAYVEVIALLKSDSAALARVVQDAYPQLDPTIAKAASASTLASWPRDGRVTEEGVKNVFEFDRIGRGVTGPVPPLSSFSDFSYLPPERP